jgi:hypothetical protein
LRPGKNEIPEALKSWTSHVGTGQSVLRARIHPALAHGPEDCGFSDLISEIAAECGASRDFKDIGESTLSSNCWQFLPGFSLPAMLWYPSRKTGVPPANLDTNAPFVLHGDLEPDEQLKFL